MSHPGIRESHSSRHQPRAKLELRSNAATRPGHRGEAGVAAAVSTQRAEKCGVGGAEAAAVKDSTKQTNLRGWVVEHPSPRLHALVELILFTNKGVPE